MIRKCLFLCLFTFPLFFIDCNKTIGTDEVDKLNTRAFSTRYSDIDTSLYYSKKAYDLAPPHSDARARALNNLAYIAYQQMRYDQSTHLLKHVYRESKNPLELLCADVMSMKIAQRIGDGKIFFDNRHSALRRISLLNKKKESFTRQEKNRLYYANTELHIISSTYYYYLGLDSAEIAEIHTIDDEISLEQDTAQWLYYHYMMGSDGRVGNQDVQLKKFDHLFKAYTVAKGYKITYFEANCLQAIASFLSDSIQHEYVRRERTDAYFYLLAQLVGNKAPALALENSNCLSLDLAHRAMHLFRDYKDLYQTACAYRTIGEIHFCRGEYEQALTNYQKAFHLVKTQKERSSQTVLPWIAGIHEKLSLVYSALGEKQQSDYHRNLYLDMLDNSRQNKELDSRKEILSHESEALRWKLYLFIFLMSVILILSALYAYRVKFKTRTRFHNLLNLKKSDVYLSLTQSFENISLSQVDTKELLEDECRMLLMKINDYKTENVERRAKVSLVYSIIPYLDRILAEANRMKSENKVSEERLAYVSELSDEIMSINDVLTDWIKMQQGQLRLHISTFPLQKIFSLLSLNKHSFQQKSILLHIQDTDILVKADEALTVFMLNTLTDNARKFTPEGGEVSIQVEATDEYAEISVIDTGCGLSEEDVYTLNHSKVYDSSHIGYSKDNKGFGFGIMNCKGIVNSYKKASEKFSICEFGVESVLQKGSRFWFRLPRVLLLLCSFLLPSFAYSTQADCEALFDSTFNANVEGRYSDAYNFAFQAIALMNDSHVDTLLLLSLRNEMAISALALNNWKDYRINNDECVRLHRLYTQDSSLAEYCLQMEQMNLKTRVFTILVVLTSVIAILLFYLLFLRGRLRVRTNVTNLAELLKESATHTLHYVEKIPTLSESEHLDTTKNLLEKLKEVQQQLKSITNGDKELDAVLLGLYEEIRQKILNIDAVETEIEKLRAKKNQIKFEENRLYVMSQILVNSLSTIKHETMYYPARTQQMVSQMQKTDCGVTEIQELFDLVTYYKKVYLLLYEQANKQLDQTNLRLERIPLQDLYSFAEQKVASYCRSKDTSVQTIFSPSSETLLGDRMLLETLFLHLISPVLRQGATCISFHHQIVESQIQITCDIRGVEKSEDDLSEMFSPTGKQIPYMIVRQIIREHDAAYNHPGLRLIAEKTENGFAVSFSLINNIMHKNNIYETV